jgi:hypothetical protein
MTILAHNLYRIMAMELEGHSECEAKTIYNKFIQNPGKVVAAEDSIPPVDFRELSLP